MNRQQKSLLLAFAIVLTPILTRADTQSLSAAQAALQAARHQSAAHRIAASHARLESRAEAVKAALLAEQQIAAAAALRRLENQTGAAANRLAKLQAQSDGASQSLAVSEAALAKLLPVMQRLSSQPAATMLAVPESPNDAIRGIIVMQGIAARIEQQAATVNQQAKYAASLLAQSKTQQLVLAHAVAVQQRAENALTAQIAAAKSAEMADAETALSEAAAALAANRQVRTLQDAVSNLQAAAAPPPMPQVYAGTASYGAPVAGTIVQNFGDDTIAGPAEGVSYLAAPGARVETPCTGPVQFADKFQNYGMVVIMDCGNGYYFVLSGMQHLDVSAGQQLSHGQPVGEMLGYDAKNPAHQPVLYVELRHNGTPVDPVAWLNGGSG
jgi:septal ring factor EnvC (AmiA/AmiB activator)